MNTPSSALSDEMKGAMSTLLNAVIFEQWLRFSWIEEDEEGDFCIQIPAETVLSLIHIFAMGSGELLYFDAESETYVPMVNACASGTSSVKRR